MKELWEIGETKEKWKQFAVSLIGSWNSKKDIVGKTWKIWIKSVVYLIALTLIID